MRIIEYDERVLISSIFQVRRVECYQEGFVYHYKQCTIMNRKHVVVYVIL